jgi:hypothetical protein
LPFSSGFFVITLPASDTGTSWPPAAALTVTLPADWITGHVKLAGLMVVLLLPISESVFLFS